MKKLHNITIVNVNCVDPKTAVKALDFSSKLIDFKERILFSDTIPENTSDQIRHVQIEKITDILDYNKFILKHLVDYIKTEYCLIIQNDGFVINPHKWTDEFLDYDYIGAPWSKYGMKVWGRTNRIGNGGFSLRSKKLMDHIKNIENIDFKEPEDAFISKIIEKDNFRYPDIPLACRFSLECPVEDYDFDVTESFGFHGKEIYNNLLKWCPNVLNIQRS